MNKEQEKVWDRLTYVEPEMSDNEKHIQQVRQAWLTFRKSYQLGRDSVKKSTEAETR